MKILKILEELSDLVEGNASKIVDGYSEYVSVEIRNNHDAQKDNNWEYSSESRP